MSIKTSFLFYFFLIQVGTKRPSITVLCIIFCIALCIYSRGIHDADLSILLSDFTPVKY